MSISEADPYDAMRSAVFLQTRNLDRVLSELSSATLEADDEPVVRVTLLMLQALGVTMHSVLKLTAERDMAIRDCYGLARSAFELAVNLCFITASGVEEARRAERHAMQKSYRDMQRQGEVGGVAFEIGRDGVPESDVVPELAEALKGFTRRGKEVRDWTPTSLSDRIASVGNVHRGAALCLSGASVSVYRHASELLHGTYFGVVHFWSGSGGRPARSRADFDALWSEHFIAVFTALFFSASAAVKLYARKYNLPEVESSDSALVAKMQSVVAELTSSSASSGVGWRAAFVLGSNAAN